MHLFQWIRAAVCVVLFPTASALAGSAGAGFATESDGRGGGGVVVRWEGRVTLAPPSPDRSFGHRVAAVGDLDGDGVADVAVAAPGVGEETTRVGRVYLFSGSEGELIRELKGVVGERFGVRVAGTVDYDLDGAPEIRVASIGRDEEGTVVERLHLISGRTGERFYEREVGPLGRARGGAARADLNRDGVVDAADIAMAVESMARGGAAGDVDGDGRTTTVDVERVVGAAGGGHMLVEGDNAIERGDNWENDPLFICWTNPSYPECEWIFPPTGGPSGIGIPGDPENDLRECVVGIGGPSWVLRGASGTLRGGASLIQGGSFLWSIPSGATLLTSTTIVGPRLDFTAGQQTGEVDIRLAFSSPLCVATAHAAHTLEIDDLFLELAGCPSTRGFDEWVRLETSYFPVGGDLHWKQISGPATTHWDENYERLEIITGFEAGVVQLVVQYALDGIERVRVCEFEVVGRPDRDHDGDGLTDAQEVVFGTAANDPDTDDDGWSDLCEWQWGSDGADAGSPDFEMAPWNSDGDADGLPDLVESCMGLDPEHFDSDGDGLADGFEVEHGLDPENPDTDGDGIPDFDEDEDNDGLTNGQEQAHDTDPSNPDSDGDGVPDGEEVDQGSFPNDPSDGGQPPPDEVAVRIALAVGDPSVSQSERWGLIVGPRRLIAPQGGVISETYTFKRGESHLIRVQHMGSSLSPPDFDYLAAIGAQGAGVIIDDPEGLLGVVGDGCGRGVTVDARGVDLRDECNLAAGKEATLRILLLDLDVDTDNTDAFDAPAGTEAEDEAEDEEGEMGKLIALNIGDRDGDGIPGFADGLGLQPHDHSAESLHDQFVPLILRVGESFDPENDRITFSYSGSDPANVTIEPGDAGATYEPAAGALRLWLKDGVERRRKEDAASNGDYIAPHVPYTAEELGLEDGEIRVWVEAIEPSAALGDHRISVSIGALADAVRLTAYGMRVVNVGPSGGLLDTHQPILSHPTPVISATQIELTNLRPSADNLRLLADLVVSGTLDDAMSDLLPDGVIDHLDVLVNGEGDPEAPGSPAARIAVQFSKGGASSNILKPHDYTGVFNDVVTVEVEPGVNMVELVAQNSRGYVGFAERAFTVSVEAPPDELVSVTVEEIGEGIVQVHLHIAADGSPGTTFSGALYETAAGVFEGLDGKFPGTQIELIPDQTSGGATVIVTHPPFGLSGYVIWCPPGERSFILQGERTYEEQERTDWTGWELELRAETGITASTGGEFKPFVIEMLGPEPLMTMVQTITLASEFQDATGATIATHRDYQIALYQGRTFLRLEGSGQPEIMLALAPYIPDYTLVDQVGEWLELSWNFTKGFMRGFGDTGVSMWDSLGEVCQFGWHVAINYNKVAIQMRLVSGQDFFLEEDQQTIAAAAETLEAIALLALQLKEAHIDVLAAILTGDHETLAMMGEDVRIALMYAAELIQSAFDAFGEMSEYEQGRIVGRIVSEVLSDVILTAAGGGVAAAASKSATVGRVMVKLRNVPWFPPVVVQHLDDAAAAVAVSTSITCFVAGTPVHTAAGLTAIELVTAGDLVLSRDEQTGALGYQKVLRTFVTHPTTLFHLSYLSESDDSMGDSITGTGEHPFYVIDAERFVPMKEVLIGDRLLLSDGVSIAYVTDIQVQRGPPAGLDAFTTYNFEVEGWHTYFVGGAGDETVARPLGVWVHNEGAACHAIASVDKALELTTNLRGVERFKKVLDLTQPIPRQSGMEAALRSFTQRLTTAIYTAAESLQDLPTVRSLKNLKSSATYGPRLTKRSLHVHHVVPKYLLRRLIRIANPRWTATEVDDYLLSIADDMPGMLLHQFDHNLEGKTISGFHRKMSDLISYSEAHEINDPGYIRAKIREAYDQWGLPQGGDWADRWLESVFDTP